MTGGMDGLNQFSYNQQARFEPLSKLDLHIWFYFVNILDIF